MTEDIVFDKAKWHYGGNFPSELKNYQAFVHTGFYLGWIIINKMTNEDFRKEYSEAITLINQRKLSPVQFYQDSLDGVFNSEILTKEGVEFTKNYFELESGLYLKDYEIVFCKNAPTLYHVKDTWNNFNTICDLIARRYRKYLRKNSLNPIKAFFARFWKYR